VGAVAGFQTSATVLAALALLAAALAWPRTPNLAARQHGGRGQVPATTWSA
jgi:hypothetical protein